MTPAYIERRVKEVDPGYVCGEVPTKPRFNEEEKAGRVAWCRLYVAQLASFWYNWVFVDEFTIYTKAGRVTAIHRRGDHLTLTHANLKNFDFASYGTLAMCIAVNAYVGLVGKWWIHNTTGYQGPVFTVSVLGRRGSPSCDSTLLSSPSCA